MSTRLAAHVLTRTAASRIAAHWTLHAPTARWTFAKTMPRWPHEYIVRERVDRALFVALVERIRAHGYEGRFYHRSITYFDHDGMVYWTMGAPIDETTIVNRFRSEDTYEARLRNGTLP